MEQQLASVRKRSCEGMTVQVHCSTWHSACSVTHVSAREKKLYSGTKKKEIELVAGIQWKMEITLNLSEIQKNKDKCFLSYAEFRFRYIDLGDGA